MNQIIRSQGLSSQQLREIRELEVACRRKEPLHIKLNWDMLEQRPDDEVNDLLYYEDNGLVGFLGLYALGSSIEATGMVHPDYRRQGIFQEMYQMARQECRTRSFGRMLLVVEHSSDAGIGFVRKTDSRYAFSEYRMKFAGKAVPNSPSHGITLRKAGLTDLAELMRLDAAGFGLPESGNAAGPETGYHYDSTYVAELNGHILGKIAVLMDGENSYIFGFVIKPEERRRGYGREVLSLLLGKLVSEHKTPVILEVAARNEQALSLYQSCGFTEVTVYDYFEVKTAQ